MSIKHPDQSWICPLLSNRPIAIGDLETDPLPKALSTEEKLELAITNFKRIAIESEENNNFSSSAKEAQFYIDVASETLAKLGIEVKK